VARKVEHKLGVGGLPSPSRGRYSGGSPHLQYTVRPGHFFHPTAYESGPCAQFQKYFFRFDELRIPAISRYFATVRRAMTIFC
jgi:hypothetical protein